MKRTKGKWSKKAKEMQSIRMKERFRNQRRLEASKLIGVTPSQLNGTTATQEIDSIIESLEALKRRLTSLTENLV